MQLLQALKEREVGVRDVARHAASSERTALVERMERIGTLPARGGEGHDGCVNTVSFSAEGELLASGSDDLQIVLWDWQAQRRRLAFDSGHTNNVFQARFLPHSCNKTLITAAADGQVRLAQLGEAGAVTTKRLARHRGRAHKLAIEPGSPHCFLGSGEDGEVRHFDLREPSAGQRRLLICTNSRGYPIELNSVHWHPSRPQFCVGGGDVYCRVYDVRRPQGVTPVRRLAPAPLRAARGGRFGTCHITCAVYSERSPAADILVTYNDECMYLFAAEERRGMGGAGAGSRQHAGHGASKRTRSSDDAPAAEQRRAVRRQSGGGDDAAAGRVAPASTAAALAAAEHVRVRQRMLQDDGAMDMMEPPRAFACHSATLPGSGTGTASGASRRQDADGAGTGTGMAVEDEARAGPRAGRGAEAGSTGAGPGSRGSASSGEPQASGASDSGEPAFSESSSGGSSNDSSEEEESASEGGSEEEEDEEEEEEEDDEESEDYGYGDDYRLLLRGGTPPAEGGIVVDRADASPSSSEDDAAVAAGVDEVLQSYRGHRNAQTVKGCSFFGDRDELVLSGSDCGSIFIFGRASGALRMLLENADTHVVNCLEPHPSQLLTLATSGIDSDVKLWAPGPERRPPGSAAAARTEANLRRQGQRSSGGFVISPEMLQMLLMRRGGGGGGDNEDSEGEGADAPRPGDCTIG